MIKELALSAILAISLISCSLSYHFGTHSFFLIV